MTEPGRGAVCVIIFALFSLSWAGVSNPAPRIFLIDTYGFIFRAFHARARMQAPPMRTSSGVPTEAVLIFHNMLR
jgi:5'-3' exonuclease